MNPWKTTRYSNYFELSVFHPLYVFSTVPEVSSSSTDDPDYTVLQSQQPGQLYAFRVSQNRVVLRTRVETGDVRIGVQSPAEGQYGCVATNFDKTLSITIEVRPIGMLNKF